MRILTDYPVLTIQQALRWAPDPLATTGGFLSTVFPKSNPIPAGTLTKIHFLVHRLFDFCDTRQEESTKHRVPENGSKAFNSRRREFAKWTIHHSVALRYLAPKSWLTLTDTTHPLPPSFFSLFQPQSPSTFPPFNPTTKAECSRYKMCYGTLRLETAMEMFSLRALGQSSGTLQLALSNVSPSFVPFTPPPYPCTLSCFLRPHEGAWLAQWWPGLGPTACGMCRAAGRWQQFARQVIGCGRRLFAGDSLGVKMSCSHQFMCVARVSVTNVCRSEWGRRGKEREAQRMVDGCLDTDTRTWFKPKQRKQICNKQCTKLNIYAY